MSDLNQNMKKWRKQNYLDSHMSPGLKAYLEECWNKYTPGVNVEALCYNTYSNVHNRGGRRKKCAASVCSLLQALAGLNRPASIQVTGTPEEIQETEQLFRTRFNVVKDGSLWPFSAQLLGRLADECSQNRDLRKAMEENFIHFRCNRGPGKRRLYMSVKGDRRKNVAQWINSRFLYWGNLDNWKVSVPSGNWSRIDTFILYFSDDVGRQRCIDDLKAYQEKAENRMHFRPEHPHMLKKVEDLMGIATGDEPICKLEMMYDTKNRVVLAPVEASGAASFGSYRAKIIAAAMTLTKDKGEDKDTFLRRAGCFLELGGVNPMHPDKNADPHKLIKLANRVVKEAGPRKMPIKTSKDLIRIRQDEFA
ncbi:MAG: hypothetical protein AAF913_02175 [Pseudomonadota bacterium]